MGDNVSNESWHFRGSTKVFGKLSNRKSEKQEVGGGKRTELRRNNCDKINKKMKNYQFWKFFFYWNEIIFVLFDEQKCQK